MAQAQTAPKRPLMPHDLLKAAIDGNETDLKQLLGLNDKDQDHSPHMMVPIEEETPMESSACWIKSAAGMENTILHILSANGHEKLVPTICVKDKSLLKACNVRGETPFHHAARFGHVDTILNLIKCSKIAFGEDPNVLKELLRQKNCLGETALHEAGRHGHGGVVSTLMEEDLELAGLVNDDSVSPLYLATARGSLDIVKNMVEKLSGHEITPAFYSGPKKQTALHAAVLQYRELTEELLKLYSEPLGKGKDETGRNPFHFVASTGNHEIAKLLLDKDPSLAYIQDSNGSFPVHSAVQMGHIKMIVLLLQRYPDSGQLLDSRGKNFLHIAIEAKKAYVLLKLKHPKYKLPISYWKKMINKMSNTMDNKGNTPLHLAAEYESNNAMLYLLKNNELDLTLQNKEGLTAPDISVIQLRKHKSPLQKRDILGEFYIKKIGSRFSTGWFQHYTKDQIPKSELKRGTNQDHISTTDARGAKTNSEILMAKAQLVGLGSVLTTTVTFAAAFTLPGGTNQDTGTPILGRKYFFKAFVLADFIAFLLSFVSTMTIIYSSSAGNYDNMERNVAFSMSIFTVAARCMVIALALGLYLVLDPISNTGIAVLVSSIWYLFYMNNPFGTVQQFQGIKLEKEILNHIPDGAGNRNHKKITATKEFCYCNFKFYVPTLIPFVIIFLFALI